MELFDIIVAYRQHRNIPTINLIEWKLIRPGYKEIEKSHLPKIHRSKLNEKQELRLVKLEIDTTLNTIVKTPRNGVSRQRMEKMRTGVKALLDT